MVDTRFKLFTHYLLNATEIQDSLYVESCVASSDGKIHTGFNHVRGKPWGCLEITSDGLPPLVQGSLNQMTDGPPGSCDCITHSNNHASET